jgi:hypothetical protein
MKRNVRKNRRAEISQEPSFWDRISNQQDVLSQGQKSAKRRAHHIFEDGNAACIKLGIGDFNLVRIIWSNIEVVNHAPLPTPLPAVSTSPWSFNDDGYCRIVRSGRRVSDERVPTCSRKRTMTQKRSRRAAESRLALILSGKRT